MVNFDELFEMRKVVGNRLEEILKEQKITKSGICSNSGISRPTFDKILKGELNNKVNFDKHLLKLLNYLGIGPNEFMGSVENPYVEFKDICDTRKIDAAALSKRSGVSIENLKRIESGESLPLIQMRDIAFLLGTSLEGMLGNNYFQLPISALELVLNNDKNTIRSPGGFWGYIGILSASFDKYEWHPISSYTKKIIEENRKKAYMAVPCLDNALLIINNENIDEIALWDGSHNKPDLDWDDSVGHGEIPAVVYELFDDYYECLKSGKKPSEYNLSENLFRSVDIILNNKKITPEEFNKGNSSVSIKYSRGNVTEHCVAFDADDDLDNLVMSIYESGNPFGDGKCCITDISNAEIIINLNNISVMKIPLSKLEKMISERKNKNKKILSAE